MSWGFDELAVSITGPHGQLIGVIRPSPIPTGPIALIVAGRPHTRYGPHRMFHQLARWLADRGISSLRIDCGGWGDSAGQGDNLEDSVDDIVVALHYLGREHPDRPLVLVGLSEGASAAILAAASTELRLDAKRIAGIALINPWVRSERIISPPALRSEPKPGFLSRKFWARLFRRKPAAVEEHSHARSLSDALLAALQVYDRRVLTVLAGDDPTADDTEDLIGSDPRWRNRLGNSRNLLRIPGADHTFSYPDHWRHVCDWLSSELSEQS
ncbi:MAG: alpha/beta fold hydrolase [Burkholderiaceae bacterium]|nr:alpha/beta fold hydrolase [Burkholderiaceae bacterium]